MLLQGWTWSKKFQVHLSPVLNLAPFTVSLHGVENQIFTLCLKFDMEPDNDFPRICSLEAIIFSCCMFKGWNFANLLQLPLSSSHSNTTPSFLLQTNLKRNLFPVIQHPSHTQASYNDSLNLLRSLQWWLRCVASTSPSVLLPWASHCHSHSLTWRHHPASSKSRLYNANAWPGWF